MVGVAVSETVRPRFHMYRIWRLTVWGSTGLWLLSWGLYSLSLRGDSPAAGGSPDPIRIQIAFVHGGVWIFNQGAPYTGCLMYLDNGDGTITSSGGTASPVSKVSWQLEKSIGCVRTWYRDVLTKKIVGINSSADYPGVYYRRFDWTDVWSTLRIGFWWPIALTSILPRIELIRRCWRTRWLRANR